MEASVSCWTCKGRKIQCDRRLPACRNCHRSRRTCQGYEARLSWPRSGDVRRAMTVKCSPFQFKSGCAGQDELLFLNTTWWDMELHQHVLAQENVMRGVPPARVPPVMWTQPQGKVKNADLIKYFETTAYQSLVTFGGDPSPLRDLLLHMVLADQSIASHALYHALLAVSSLCRDGLHYDAVGFKISALNALCASSKQGPLTPTAAAQHIATCMLLCAFELHRPSDSSGEWLVYTHSAMDIMQETLLEHEFQLHDVRVLVDWVYYHSALARFTTLHWRQKALELNAKGCLAFQPWTPKSLTDIKKTPRRSLNPGYEILNLLCEVNDVLVTPEDPRSQDNQSHDRLQTLESKIVAISTPSLTSTSEPQSGTIPPLDIALYQMTTLIYLIRASQNPWGRTSRLSTLVDRVFTIAYECKTCPHFFPLFILACEARTDEQRRAIMHVIDSTERHAVMRSMGGLRAAIRMTWVQQDLYADGELIVDYLRVINGVISSFQSPPSYA